MAKAKQIDIVEKHLKKIDAHLKKIAVDLSKSKDPNKNFYDFVKLLIHETDSAFAEIAAGIAKKKP